MLANYACDYNNIKPRLHLEEEDQYRTPFQRDRDRIIHSQSFRRLEYKTQVFVNFASDHFRTRLTHSLEVSQISRSLASRLEIDQDLAEAIALAHDIGHPPFGHSGETALNKMMQKYGGFDHNIHTMRILIELEEPYALFSGLNLTYELLEGILKHNGPLTGKIDKIIKDYNKKYQFDLKKYSCLEAQIASLADDIAYNNHDIDDGFRAGFISMKDFQDIELIDQAIKYIYDKYPKIDEHKKLYEIRRIIYSKMIDDVIAQTKENLVNYNINSCAEVRNHKDFTASFSKKMAEQIALLKKLLYEKIYANREVRYMHYNADRIISDIFAFYMENPKCLNQKLQDKFYKINNSKHQARVICDYIAGMTDRFAYKHHAEIFKLHI